MFGLTLAIIEYIKTSYINLETKIKIILHNIS